MTRHKRINQDIIDGLTQEVADKDAEIRDLRRHIAASAKNPRQPFEWRPRVAHADEFEDGSAYLVALRVQNSQKGTEWWEVSVVRVRCDEGQFDVEDCEGNDWGWSWEDVEYYVPLRDVLRSVKVAVQEHEVDESRAGVAKGA